MFHLHVSKLYHSYLITHLGNKRRLSKCGVSYPNRRMEFIQMLHVCKLRWSHPPHTLPRGREQSLVQQKGVASVLWLKKKKKGNCTTQKEIYWHVT